MVLSHTLALRKIEALPAAPPNRPPHPLKRIKKNQRAAQAIRPGQDLLCFAKVQARTVGSKKIRPNRNCASQTRTAQGNPAADLERSYQLPPRRKPSPAER